MRLEDIKEEKIEVCMWKKIALNDERKRKEENYCTTFGENSECNNCTGYQTDCKAYALINKIGRNK